MGAIGREDETDFLAFRESELSEEQIEDVGRRMSRVHAAFGVRRATEEHRGLFDRVSRPKQESEITETVQTPVRVVIKERLHGLWKDIKGEVDTIFRDYVIYRAHTTGDTSLDSLAIGLGVDLDAFWSEQKYRMHVVFFKEVLSAIGDAVFSEEVRRIAAEYRNEFKDRTSDSADVRKKYQDAFTRIMLERLRDTLDDEHYECAQRIARRMVSR